MKKIYVFFLVVLAGLSQGFSSTPGSKAMTFLNMPPNPRAASMGDAFTGLADDVSSVYWNPAGIGKMKGVEIALNMNLHIESLRYYNVQGIIPLSFGSLGAGFSMLDYGNIENYQDGVLAKTALRPSDILASLAYGLKLTEKLFVGGTAKFALEDLSDEYSSMAVGFDAGILFNSPLSIGLVLQNAGLGPKFDLERAGLPMNAKLGIAYKGNFTESLTMNFTLDFILPADSSFKIKYGTEIWFKNIFNNILDVAVRMGFRYPTDLGLLSSFTFGGGVKISKFQLDYSLANFGNEFGITHQFGVLSRFGKSASDD